MNKPYCSKLLFKLFVNNFENFTNIEFLYRKMFFVYVFKAFYLSEEEFRRAGRLSELNLILILMRRLKRL